MLYGLEPTDIVGDACSGELFDICGRFTCLGSEMEESTDVFMRFLLPAYLDGLRLPSFGLTVLLPFCMVCFFEPISL